MSNDRLAVGGREGTLSGLRLDYELVRYTLASGVRKQMLYR
jgi:hypothetical protein